MTLLKHTALTHLRKFIFIKICSKFFRRIRIRGRAPVHEQQPATDTGTTKGKSEENGQNPGGPRVGAAGASGPEWRTPPVSRRHSTIAGTI
jgi:hypothetical protein